MTGKQKECQTYEDRERKFWAALKFGLVVTENVTSIKNDGYKGSFVLEKNTIVKVKGRVRYLMDGSEVSHKL